MVFPESPLHDCREKHMDPQDYWRQDDGPVPAGFMADRQNDMAGRQMPGKIPEQVTELRQ